MVKKVYNISGFDCANCAARTESFLNRDERIEYARIDFSSNRLYITYKNKELSIDEIKSLIKEVESNNIIVASSNEKIQNEKFFNKKNIILLARIVITIILMLCARFAMNQDDWPCIIVYAISILLIGYDVFYKVVYKIIHFKNPIDEFLLITLGVSGVVILSALSYAKILPEGHNEFFEGVMVILLFQIGQVVEHYASNKSRNAISTAMDLRTENALLFDGIDTKTVPSKKLKIGDLIIVKVGDVIPVDGVVVEGEGTLDISSLTGEYIPKLVKADDEALSGCLLKSGTLTLQVQKTYQDSTVSKIVELVNNSGEKKANAISFISKFAKWYTPIIMLGSFIFLLIFGFVNKDWVNATTKALEFVIIACPCAIVISVPLSYFAGIGLASKNGIVIKGSNFMDALCSFKKLITDKTGTLTHGSFTISRINPIDISEASFKEYLFAAECLSNHPIGKAIMQNIKDKNYINKIKNYNEIIGRGVTTDYMGHHLIAGTRAFLLEKSIEVKEASDVGTIVYLSLDGKYIGYCVLSDEIKKDAQPMVDLLHHAGIEIVLLTGDKENTAAMTCKELGIDRWHSELSPSEKTKCLEMEMNNSKRKVAFIGDGINDAPSIIRSDIGIAMGGIGSDIAVNNADIVIMNDNPVKVYEAYKIAKMTRNRAFFCIIFSLAVKLAVTIAAAVTTIPMWLAVLSDTGLTVVMIVCALLLLYQKVHHPKRIMNKYLK